MIQELMIINKAGIALFYHSFSDENRDSNKQSLASYFDIICRFTKHSFKESLRMITLDSFIFFFYTHESNYHLVLKCLNKEINRELLQDIAEIIINAFNKKYKDILRDFNGEISQFKSFSGIVRDIIKSKMRDFRELVPAEH